jgi:hypothetical protein
MVMRPHRGVVEGTFLLGRYDISNRKLLPTFRKLLFFFRVRRSKTLLLGRLTQILLKFSWGGEKN